MHMARQQNRRPRLLLCHPWMAGGGGSEACAIWAVQSLKDDYDITFATASDLDLPALNKTYGTSVRESQIEVVGTPRLPFVTNANTLAYLQRKRFEAFCRRLAPKFDLCLSAYNPMDFGRPAIHLLGDFSWEEELRRAIYPPDASNSIRHKDTPVRRRYLNLTRLLYPKTNDCWRAPGNLVLANSNWSAGMLALHCKVDPPPVLYPPVPVPIPTASPPASDRQSNAFLCLGRISYEKRTDQVIEILSELRKRGRDVTLHLAGGIGDDPYGRMVSRMARERSNWVVVHGIVLGQEKYDLMRRIPYGISACPIEAFGIAAAEMVLSGCLVFIPGTGGTPEVVNHAALQFGDPAEALNRIENVLDNPPLEKELHEHLAREAGRFSVESFRDGLRHHVARFLSSPEAQLSAPKDNHG